MIQLNLLPDVKQEYLKAQRTRRLVISVAALITLGSIGLLVLLLSFGALQTKHLSDLNKDIASDTSKLKNQNQIDKILTVQNQLNSLSKLHASKPAASRVFDFLNQVTPDKVSINSFTIDFTQQTIMLTGTADSISTVNKFVDTLKFTSYTTTDPNTKTKAFSGVVLTSYAISGTGSSQATYAVNLKYDPILFDISKPVKLIVPSITTTRSSIDKPSDLFQGSPTTTTSGGN